MFNEPLVPCDAV